MSTHDFHEAGRSFQNILFYMRGGGKLSQWIAFLYLHNLLRIDNLIQVDMSDLQTIARGHNIIRVNHLMGALPHILRGTSKSRTIG